MIKKDLLKEYDELKKALQKEFQKKKSENGGGRNEDRIRELQNAINALRIES